MTWRPRFSLRTLVVFLLLCTSGAGLWYALDQPPWVRSTSLSCSGYEPKHVRFVASDTQIQVLAFSASVLGGPVAHGRPSLSRISFDAAEGKMLRRDDLEHPSESDRLLSRRGARPLISSDGVLRVMINHSSLSELPPVTVVTSTQSKTPLHLLQNGVTLPHGYRYSVVFVDSTPCGAFSSDGDTFAVLEDSSLTVYRRRRPEWWWGVFYLWEFWLTALFAGLFVWSVVRDRRRIGVRLGITE